MSEESQRVDKWLWYARFRKTRTMAAKLCEARKVRLNGNILSKPSHLVRPGDILTFPQGRQIKVVRIESVAKRRGPASEAATLYKDQSPDFKNSARTDSNWRGTVNAERAPGAGRPTKRDRRQIARLHEEASRSSPRPDDE